jgi:hypothetical protein
MATRRSPTRRLNQLARTAARNSDVRAWRQGTVLTTSRGAWRKAPDRSVLPPGLGALAYSLQSPQDARSPPRRCQGIRTPVRGASDEWQAVQARAHDARARRRRRPTPILFPVALFKNAKLEISKSKLKISKYESCRGTLGLQLLQRAT